MSGAKQARFHCESGDGTTLIIAADPDDRGDIGITLFGPRGLQAYFIANAQLARGIADALISHAQAAEGIAP